MPRSRLKSRAKKPPKRVLALPDLEQALTTPNTTPQVWGTLEGDPKSIAPAN